MFSAVPVVSARVRRSLISSAFAIVAGAFAIKLGGTMSPALHRGLAFIRADDLVVWSVVLGAACALLAFTRTISRGEDWSRAFHRMLARLGDALGSIPAGVALPWLVVAAFATRVGLDHDAATPRIFADELIYSGIGKALAAGAGFELRGMPIGVDYSPLYVLLLSVVYRFAEGGAEAYSAIQKLNAVAMSVTAVPAYFLARRTVSQGWSLVVGALSVAVPAMAYTSLVLTEPIFYPGFVAACLVLTLTMERPTVMRQALCIASICALAAIRVQALVLVPAFITAVLITGFRARSLVSLRRFVPAGAMLAALAGGLLIAHRGDVTGPLGAYGDLVRDYSVWEVGRWLVFNIAVLDVSLGFVAFGTFVVVVTRLLGRQASPREEAFGAVSIGVVAWTSVSVALLSASPYGLDRLHWRSLFVVIPVFLVCLAWWLQSGMPRPWLTTIGAAVVTLGLPLLVPWRLIAPDFPIDSPATVTWRKLGELAPAFAQPRVIAPFAVAAVAIFLLARSPVLPIATVLLAFGTLAAALAWKSDVARDRAERFAWVDAALRDGAPALMVHVEVPEGGCPNLHSTSRQRVLEVMTEFFNSSITRVQAIGGQIGDDGLHAGELSFGEDGSLRDDGAVLSDRYLVVDSRFELAGDRVARVNMRDIEGPASTASGSLTLWSTDSPVRLADVGQVQSNRFARLACRPADAISPE